MYIAGRDMVNHRNIMCDRRYFVYLKYFPERDHFFKLISFRNVVVVVVDVEQWSKDKNLHPETNSYCL